MERLTDIGLPGLTNMILSWEDGLDIVQLQATINTEHHMQRLLV